VRHCRPIAWNDGADLTNNGLRLRGHYLSGTVLADSGHGGDYLVSNEAVLLNCYSEDAPGLRVTRATIRWQYFNREGLFDTPAGSRH
jgi:hypothetical protein